MTSVSEPSTAKPLPALTQAGHERDAGGSLGRASANFWRRVFYWWVAHWPPMVLLTRPFFLWFALRFSKALRDGPTANARRILGDKASHAEVECLRRRIVISAYTSIYELGRAARSTPSELRAWIERADGMERYAATRKARTGAILVTAHLGPFEVGAAGLMEREPKVHVVFRRDEQAGFDRIRTRLRATIGLTEAALDDGWSVWSRMCDALRRDEVVLIQGDRVMPGQRGVAVPFFDGHILLPTGPVKLAMAGGSPIIPVFSVRTRVGRCRVVIDEPIDVPRELGPIDGDHAAMRHIAAAIERQVRAHPEQWAIYERAWCEDNDIQSTV